MICNCKTGIIPQSQVCYDQMTVLEVPKSVNIRYNAPGAEPKTHVAVDPCMAKEIKQLWEMGIVTTGCCCGHGLGGGYFPYIGVREDFIPRMKQLGYKVQFNPCRPNDEDSFVPKSI